MLSFVCKLCIIVPIVFCFICNASNLEDLYGPFQLRISKLAHCKGPKPKNCGVAQLHFSFTNGTILQTHFVVNEKISSAKARLVGMSNGKRLAKVEVNSLCQHMQLRILFEYALNLTEDCTITKGVHNASLDMNKAMNDFYGEKFVYGNITFTNSFYSNKCNYFCMIIGFTIVPKTSE